MKNLQYPFEIMALQSNSDGIHNLLAMAKEMDKQDSLLRDLVALRGAIKDLEKVVYALEEQDSEKNRSVAFFLARHAYRSIHSTNLLPPYLAKTALQLGESTVANLVNYISVKGLLISVEEAFEIAKQFEEAGYKIQALQVYLWASRFNHISCDFKLWQKALKLSNEIPEEQRIQNQEWAQNLVNKNFGFFTNKQ